MNPTLLKLLLPLVQQIGARALAQWLNQRREHERERLFEAWLAERRGKKAVEADRPPEPEVEVAPPPAPARQASSFWLGLLGGLVGAILGFAVARMTRDELRAP